MRILTQYLWVFILLANFSVIVAREDEAWIETNCTVIENDCKVQEDGSCHWWYPFCLVRPPICEDSGLKPPQCCVPDECGDSFGANVKVQFLSSEGLTEAFAYNTISGSPVSSTEEVNTFLSIYLNDFMEVSCSGTTHPCYYQKTRSYKVVLDPGHICHNHGKYNSSTRKCDCFSHYEGPTCDEIVPDAPNNQKVERVYYIAAEEVIWDYAPSNRDLISQINLNESTRVLHNPMMWVGQGPERIGKVYKKARYVEYKDRSFTTPKEIEPNRRHLGLLGPPIHAAKTTAVGEVIKVFFKNKCKDRAYSLHPHGVLYEKTSEGSPYGEGGMNLPGGRVGPGDIYTYTWEVPERAGPGPNDPSSIVWLYHSHVDEGQDTSSGLVGPIVISAKGKGRYDDGSPKNVDQEIFLYFTIYDETRSWYIRENIQTYLLNGTANKTEEDRLIADPGFIMSSFKYAVNGYLYANVPDINVTLGERVRWYTLALGSEPDLHGIHWHGSTLLHAGTRVDSIDLIPASTRTLDMVPDVVGEWMFHCHTTHHIHGGMSGLYRVKPCTVSWGCGANANPPNWYPDPLPQKNTSALVYLFGILFSVALYGAIGVWWWRRRKLATKPYQPVDSMQP